MFKSAYSIEKQIFFQAKRVIMTIIKALHVLCVFIWMGNLLALTRLMGYHVKQDEHTQRSMAKLYKKMYTLVGLPTLVFAILFGIIMLILSPTKPTVWFHVKMTFFIPLFICDIVCGRYIMQLNQKTDLSRGVKYKILHGICGLMLIGILGTIYVLKPTAKQVDIAVAEIQDKK